MTITHEFNREEVMAYLDGELAPARALQVHAHVETCPECSALASDLRQVSTNLRDWTVESAPSRLVAPAGMPTPPVRRWWPRALALPIAPRWIAIGVASAAVLGFVVLTQMQLRVRPAAKEWDLNGRISGSADAVSPTRALGYASASKDGRGFGNGTGRGGVPTDGAMRRDPSQIVAMSPGVSLDNFGVNGTLGPQVQQGQTAPAAVSQSAQMIERTGIVNLQTEKFDDMRAGLERVAATHHGSLSGLNVQGDPPNQRTLSATMRVPVAEMDAALVAVRGLGRVLQESQSSDDVTDAHRDLAIRISNAKVEEARLGEILKDRTGKLSDVLAVEQAQSRVRTQIEQMEAEELAMRNRAAQSTITISVQERYRAELADSGPTPVGTRLRNALVDGARAAIDSAVGATLAVLGAAPTLLLWTIVLFVPVRILWRRLRRSTISA